MKPITYSLLLIFLSFGCTPKMIQVGANDYEKIIGVECFQDFSKIGKTYLPLSGILLKAESIQFKKKTSEINFDEKIEWHQYEFFTKMKLVENWRNIVGISTKKPIKRNVHFEISVNEIAAPKVFKKSKNIWQSEDQSKRWIIKLFENNDDFYFEYLSKIETPEFYIFSKEKIIKLRVLNLTKEEKELFLTSFVTYSLTEGIAFSEVSSFAFDDFEYKGYDKEGDFFWSQGAICSEEFLVEKTKEFSTMHKKVIEGRIISEGTGLPMPDVRIYLGEKKGDKIFKTETLTPSGENGIFKIEIPNDFEGKLLFYKFSYVALVFDVSK